MLKINAHLLLGLTLLAFSLLAIASKVNKIHFGAFNYSNNIEDTADRRMYIMKNDGTKIYGNKISYSAGIFSKNQVKIDGQAFKIAEIKGYRAGSFYARLGHEYIKRIIHGKINVYVQFTEVTNTSTDHLGHTYTHTYTRTDHFAQIGEDGELFEIAGQNDIKKLLIDCPAAVAMIDKSNSQIRKAIRKNPNYLNRIFDVYNNGCAPAR